ncbi:MAG: DNRLRE domain-containing protein [Candidatus Binatia bacterium]
MRFPHIAHPGRLAALALALLIAPTLVRAETLVVPVAKNDAFIMKNFKNRITGARNTRLRVEAAPLDNKVKRSLVQFDLSQLPAGSTVSSAVIGLYAEVNAGNQTLTHGVHRILAPWEEARVKWNNQPPFAASASATTLVGTGRGFKSFDVTGDVQAAINLCSADNGWMVKDEAETASNDAIAYISSEEDHPADVPNRPQLVVTFDPPECVTDDDCKDTNFCTTNEHCGPDHRCAVAPVGCDDGNPCTEDVCDCGVGCRNESICDDGLSCTTDTCDPTTLACTNIPVDSVCVTTCSTGTCSGDPDAPDIDPNTGCLIETTAPAGTPCSDGQSCTTPDQCNASGSCVPGPKDCNDPSCGTSPLCAEQCNNCIDDNADGLIDRDDPKCGAVADGNGQGAGDPRFKGKPILRCQKAIRAAGSRYASQLRTNLQKCTDGVFLCLQQKPGDAGCLNKARARCAKQTAVLQGGATSLDLRLGAKITKGCGPKKPGLLPVVSGTDLCRAEGLAFESNVEVCQTPQSPVLLAAVTSAIAEEHRCRTVELFATDVPRATELLSSGGVDLSTLPCLLDETQGGTLGLGKPAAVVKAVVSCQRGIGTAGARFVKQVLAAEQRCSEAVAQCIQTKPGDAKCLTKAQKVCRTVTGKLYTGPQSREAKLRTSIARACGSTTVGKAPRVALGDLRSLFGIGYDSLDDICSGFGVGGLATLDDVSECLVRQHVCRADQLLTSQTPRANELLFIGGAIGR